MTESKLAMKPSDKVTVQEAYLAMYQFLVDFYDRTKCDDVGALLGELSLLADGKSADPAAMHHWNRCLDLAASGKVDALLRLQRTQPLGKQDAAE